MQLANVPSEKRVGRPSAVDLLPDDVRDQLIAARGAATHSVREMVRWLHEDEDLQGNPVVGAKCRAVTVSGLNQWFTSRGYRVGAG
jgi:hypothetical protein